MIIAHTFPDALQCPKCGAALSVIAYITELAVVRKILEHLGLPSAPTQLAPARLPDELGFDLHADFDPAGAGGADEDQYISSDLAGPAGRGPPPDDPGL